MMFELICKCLPRRIKSLLGALACLGMATAQSIPPDEIHSQIIAYAPPSGITLRTEVRVVEVPVVVRDGFLHAAGGLTRNDFAIYDNGKKQAITAFSVEHFAAPGNVGSAVAVAPSNSHPRPRFVVLCFDDIHLLPGPLNPVKEAGKKFVRTSLAPDDRAVVVRTSRSEDVSFTNDVPALVEQIDKITPPIMETSDDREKCPHIEPHEAYQLANSLDPGNHVLRAKMAECVPC
jgi:VWFA-related protein